MTPPTPSVGTATKPGAAEILVVVGATGTGKSSLSLELAEQLHRAGRAADIVNADASQLYRGMNVGTAKLSESERGNTPHHLFDALGVREEASVAAYQTLARATIDEILARGAVPILVGGSGLYVSSVIYDFRFAGTDPDVRARLEAELAADGPGALYSRLKLLNEKTAAAVGASNGRRLVRALEIIEITGEAHSAEMPDEQIAWRPASIVGMQLEREQLIPRLDERVRQMWRGGMLEEVRGLIPLGLERGVTASRAIGYAQALAQLRGELSEAEAIEATQALTRRYARRQVSWFRRYRGVEWLDAAQPIAAHELATSMEPWLSI